MRTSSLLLIAALAVPATAQSQDAAAVADGARVWASQCTRCHSARPSTERTDAQWLTILAHMRARGNLTRTDTRLVAAFLQATNLPEVAATPAPAPAPAAQPEASGAPPAGPARPAASWTGALSARDLWALKQYLERLAGPPSG